MTSGSDGARGVLLLHGFTGSAGSWGRGLLEGLRDAGLDPRAVDLPGHGTRAGEDDPSVFTLEATLEGLVPGMGPNRDLVGYSMGGRVALHAALRRPGRMRRLVLESASPGLAEAQDRARRQATDAALAEEIVEEGVEAFVHRWEALPLFASQRELPVDVRAAHRRGRLANHPRSLAASLRGLGTGTLPSLWDRLGEVEVPTLLLAGAQDPKFVEIGRRMQRILPRARLEVVPDAGHAIHLERPDAWLSAVTDFLGR